MSARARAARAPRFAARWCACLAMLALCACAGTAHWPKVDLTESGWRVWTGQALWTPAGDRPPIAGEVILARRAGDEIFVSFSKPPLPIFTARTLAGQWRIDMLEGGQSHSGRGEPPQRFVWLDLPGLLEGGIPRGNWTIVESAAEEWSIRNPETGEAIRLVLDL